MFLTIDVNLFPTKPSPQGTSGNWPDGWLFRLGAGETRSIWAFWFLPLPFSTRFFGKEGCLLGPERIHQCHWHIWSQEAPEIITHPPSTWSLAPLCCWLHGLHWKPRGKPGTPCLELNGQWCESLHLGGFSEIPPRSQNSKTVCNIPHHLVDLEKLLTEKYRTLFMWQIEKAE